MVEGTFVTKIEDRRWRSLLCLAISSKRDEMNKRVIVERERERLTSDAARRSTRYQLECLYSVGAVVDGSSNWAAIRLRAA